MQQTASTPIDIKKLPVAKGANHWNVSLEAAAKGGHRDLAELFISKGANN